MLNCLQSSGLLPFLNSYLWWQKMEKKVKCGILVDMPVPRTREWLFPCPSFLGTDVFPNGLWLIDQKCLSSVVIVTQEFFYLNLHSILIPYFNLFCPVAGSHWHPAFCRCPSLLVDLKCYFQTELSVWHVSALSWGLAAAQRCAVPALIWPVPALLLLKCTGIGSDLHLLLLMQVSTFFLRAALWHWSC